jgi:hypothetical protein
LFEAETQDKRRTALNSVGEIEELEKLLSILRDQKIFVLSKGCVEDYYPEDVTGNDKPTKAFNACKVVNTPQAVYPGHPMPFLAVLQIQYHLMERCNQKLSAYKSFQLYIRRHPDNLLYIHHRCNFCD